MGTVRRGPCAPSETRYGRNGVLPACTLSENWQMVRKHPSLSATSFGRVWTISESLRSGTRQLNSPIPWSCGGTPAPAPPGGSGQQIPGDIALIFANYPWFNTYCGDIDLIGEAKPW